MTLGVRDWEDRVRAPSRLFGRERELEILEGALDRVSAGAVELALVAGSSGVGKSALAHALRARVRERRGLFASGKFDQARRGLPYAALSQALRAVIRRRLADPADVLERWAEAWRVAVGLNGRILLELAPELAHVLGDTPPLVAVGPVEAKARLRRTVIRFVRATAGAEHPLALFLDDLQWADVPSLELLEELITDPGLSHLLVLGAYRDSEVGLDDPLHALRAAAGRQGRALPTLVLPPLGDEALEALCGDLLAQPAAELSSLAALVKVKTDGSPFFVEQFLRALNERRLLARDLETGGWRWDAPSIERSGVTDNVGQLLTAKIAALPEDARRVLSLGACLGASFDAALVGQVGHLDERALRGALDALARDGLILAVHDEGEDLYAPVHDRVQQAAYEALSPADREAAHLMLGRALEERYRKAEGYGELFATLHQYLRAAPRIQADDDRRRVAELCLRGGRHAKGTAAYAEAARLLAAGRALLGGMDPGADLDIDLQLDIDRALAEAEWLTGRPEVGEALLRRCQERARDRLARGRVVLTWLPLLFMAGRYDDAIRIGLDASAEWGWSFPDDPEGHQAYFAARLERLAPTLLELPPEAWRAMPLCGDPGAQISGELLKVTGTASAMGRPSLGLCTTVAMIEHALAHGLSPASAFGLGAAALILLGIVQESALGKRCLEVTLALRDMPELVRGSVLFNTCAAGFAILPVAEIRSLVEEIGERAELEEEITHLELARWYLASTLLFRGAPLAECALPAIPCRDQLAGEFATMHEAVLVALAAGPASADLVARVIALPASVATARAAVLAGAAFVALHLGEDARAVELAAEMEPLWPTTYGGISYMQMAQALTAVPLEGGLAARLAPQRALHRGRLSRYTAQSPTAFLHLVLLADAAEASAAGRLDEAERLYDEAIEHARRVGHAGDEALALRLCGELHLARGRARSARADLEAAHAAYLRWGAHAAAERLLTRHPDIAPRAPAAPEPSAHLVSTTTTTQEGPMNARLDATSVLRAAQAISEEMRIDALIARVLRVLAENAGAERAVLALARGGPLCVRAELAAEPPTMDADLDEPVETSARLPSTVVQYVARSREPVLLGQAEGDARFDDDPYLRDRRPASVLAVPLLHQGRLSGVIYLEHLRVADAFPEQRAVLVALLAAQAATAVENATLYAESAAANERLEREVADRTAELRSAKEAADVASRAKSDFLASISHELRTPLNGVLGYAQVLERSPTLAPRDAETVHIIRRSGEHLLHLINELLDLAKIEAGRLELDPRPVHLPSLVRSVSDMSLVNAARKGVAFTCSIDDRVGGVLVDQKRLTQILLNLLGNAIKFTERGEVRLRVDELRDATETAPPASACIIRICVEDTGPGIPPEHMERIFDPFEQAGDTRVRAEGAGLGLSITRRLVHRMGGRIEVESELGRGAAFTVTLRLPAADVGPELPRTGADIEGYRGERRLVLIVDDNAENRGVVRDLLAPLGFDIIEATSGEEAVSLAAARRPAAVLMDIYMPGMDGLEATRRLRREPALAGMKILASSASAAAEERARTRSAGCDDFLPKPVTADALLGALEHHLHLDWIRAGDATSTAPAAPAAPAAPGNAPAEEIRPSEEAITALLSLAERGRVRALLEEIDRLEAADARLGPWLGRLRALVERLELKAARAFLKPPGG